MTAGELFGFNTGSYAEIPSGMVLLKTHNMDFFCNMFTHKHIVAVFQRLVVESTVFIHSKPKLFRSLTGTANGYSDGVPWLVSSDKSILCHGPGHGGRADLQCHT